MSVQTRLWNATKFKCENTAQTAKAEFEKTMCGIRQQIMSFATNTGNKIKALVEPSVKQVKANIEPKVNQMMKTKQYTQACQFASKGLTFSVGTCEKIIGKEKTKSMIQKVESLILKAQKAVAPPAPTKKMK
jgi:hypothetical protein